MYLQDTINEQLHYFKYFHLFLCSKFCIIFLGMLSNMYLQDKITFSNGNMLRLAGTDRFQESQLLVE